MCNTSTLTAAIVAGMFWLASGALAQTANGDLLLNGGAEQGKGQAPSAWFEAKVPAKELKMWRDTQKAHKGKASLAISNQHVYEQTVCNNWAQTLQEVPRGKTLQLSGAVRAADADSVNICIQCWDKSGQKMLAFASTPVIRGDQEWIVLKTTEVFVPQDTASITVRAVLTGTGSAWFDDITVAIVEPTTQPAGQTTTQPSESAQQPDEELTRLAGGTVVARYLLAQDVMVLKYLPDWGHGSVDNIAVANNDGGVRLLASWPRPARLQSNNKLRFILALYSRDTQAYVTGSGSTTQPKPLTIRANAINKEWEEATSWKNMPAVADTPAIDYEFTPKIGWKVFDITPLVQQQAKDPKAVHGVMLRFEHEGASGVKKTWSGYAFVSREGAGQWLSKRPMLLVVKDK